MNGAATGALVRRVFGVRMPGLLALVVGLAGLLPSARAAVAPGFTNLANIDNPQFNATTIVNLGTINQTGTPFQPENMLNFTNAIDGTLIGNAGIQLEFSTNGAALRSIVNWASSGATTPTSRPPTW